ncbi:RagB/SusD family nutrient uptake outer membrane protein [Sabulilitoribacter multivorans]|uniref:RagB/SusD family nutrient uptake outer membrane protein n=1 Tax=Flaviramulus multivorans TaxID=1304750 RepID=A0ABS9ILW0_9FLAO|nr:RagB/SusD family nutrient uptake outer membrane protein [Flaviramulus multivorans]MCF7561537.1 RagB/SusD family nutrient uptake outer membrane protein [Flaviramulus multivorans]
MKTNKLIFCISLIIITCFSCDSFLEEEPRDIISPDNFFASDADARQGMTGIYSILKNNSIYGQAGLDNWYDNGVDIIEPNRTHPIFEVMGNYTLSAVTADLSNQLMSVSDTWQNLYRVILNTNTIIERVSGNGAISEDVQTDVIADARFIRGMAYWHITNLWGDAPFYTEVLPLEEIAKLGRTDKDVILASVLDDLEFAQNNLPSVFPTEDRGRASKWAAAIIEAKIHMKAGDWQAGLDKCLEIINQSPHSLLPNYADVFNPNNEYNEEIIWSLDFAKDITGMFEPAFPGAAFAGNNYWRPSLFNPRIRDEPANAADRDPLRAALSANGEEFNGTGLQIASLDFTNKFPMNDLRRPLNIMDTYEGFQLNHTYMPKFMNLNFETSPRFNHGDNRLVFRLADVYLMAAECENELNGPTNAYQYIHPIRQRAYATQAEWELVGLSQQQFREAIYDERKWELAAEATRRYDLIRWGIYLDVVRNAEFKTYTPGANIQDYHVLLPIPLNELLLNPNLTQNPGY